MTGFVNARHELLLDEQLPMIKPNRVRVIILLTEDDALFSEAEWLKTASQNQAFDFLKDKEEDIYSLTDGNHSMIKGKVVLVPIPFDDLSSTKVRPAVCLTSSLGVVTSF